VQRQHRAHHLLGNLLDFFVYLILRLPLGALGGFAVIGFFIACPLRGPRVCAVADREYPRMRNPTAPQSGRARRARKFRRITSIARAPRQRDSSDYSAVTL
jgi:hypothetical protein